MDNTGRAKFFKLIKGVPIRWTGWADGKYFVAKHATYAGYLYGITYWKYSTKSTTVSFEDRWVVSNGFNDGTTGNRWEYYTEHLMYEEIAEVLGNIDRS